MSITFDFINNMYVRVCKDCETTELIIHIPEVSIPCLNCCANFDIVEYKKSDRKCLAFVRIVILQLLCSKVRKCSCTIFDTLNLIMYIF